MINPKDRPSAEALLEHDFIKSRLPNLETPPPMLEIYLPQRPINLAALPGPKRKMIKSLVEKAVAQKLTAKQAEDDVQTPLDLKGQSTINLVPYFQDK